MNNFGTIYVLRCNINGKCYIGQTIKTVWERISDHKLKRSVIGLAINKYGLDSFSIFSYTHIPLEFLDFCEIELIKRLNSVSPSGYNIMLGGQKNRLFSDETRKRMSRSQMGKKRSPESIEKVKKKLRGRKRPQHIIDMLIARNTGSVKSEETREKISNSLKGNIPWNKGKKMNQEYIEKNSLSHIGHRHSEETKAKMRASHYKRLHGSEKEGGLWPEIRSQPE